MDKSIKYYQEQTNDLTLNDSFFRDWGWTAMITKLIRMRAPVMERPTMAPASPSDIFSAKNANSAAINVTRTPGNKETHTVV